MSPENKNPSFTNEHLEQKPDYLEKVDHIDAHFESDPLAQKHFQEAAQAQQETADLDRSTAEITQDALVEDARSLVENALSDEVVDAKPAAEQLPYDEEGALADLMSLGLSNAKAEELLYVLSIQKHNIKAGGLSAERASKETFLSDDGVSYWMKRLGVADGARQAFSEIAHKAYDVFVPPVVEQTETEAATPEDEVSSDDSEAEVKETDETMAEIQRDLGALKQAERRIDGSVQGLIDTVGTLKRKLNNFSDGPGSQLGFESVVSKTRTDMADILSKLQSIQREQDSLYESANAVMKKTLPGERPIKVDENNDHIRFAGTVIKRMELSQRTRVGEIDDTLRRITGLLHQPRPKVSSLVGRRLTARVA